VKEEDPLFDFEDVVWNREEEPEMPVITQECRDLLLRLMEKNLKDRTQLIDVQIDPWFSLSEAEIEEQVKKIKIKLQNE